MIVDRSLEISLYIYSMQHKYINIYVLCTRTDDRNIYIYIVRRRNDSDKRSQTQLDIYIY